MPRLGVGGAVVTPLRLDAGEGGSLLLRCRLATQVSLTYMRTPRPTSRRGFLGGTLAVSSVAALGGLLTACGEDTEAETAGTTDAGGSTGASAPAGPWTWTDELDQTIDLDQAPTRIAAYGDQAAALIGFGIRPIAIFHYMDPAQDSAFDDIDLDGIEVVGTSYGEINLEQLAVLQPDLVLTTFYGEDTPDTMYGFKDKTQIEKIREIAPITGVMMTGSALDVIQKNEEIVGTLGVDVESGQVAEDRAAFEAASAALTEAAAGGLTVLPIYAEDANLYIAKAPDDPALKYYADLGLQFVPVTGEDYYWEILSWENADKYSPDIVLYSQRDSYTPEQLQEQPVFAALPAMAAGQLHPWPFKSMDYPAQTGYLNELVEWLGSSSKVT
jgi:iron complex transport system substrate-binding protein